MDEIAKAIRDISAKRADGVPIPARAPSGWVHLSVAMAKIAHAMLGEANDTWQDAFRAVIEGALKDATDAPSDPLAAEVGAYVCEQIAEICRTETLITGFRRVGGACDVAVMPGAWWDTEDPELRFSTFSIDPDDLTSSRLDLPCWIWVDAFSLANHIQRIERWKGRTVIFGVYGDEACSLAEAVALVSEAVDGDAYRAFLWLAANQGTRVVAGEMVRYFQGVPVERDIEWPVPPSLWLCVNPDDPTRRLNEGTLRAASGPSVWTLSALKVDLQLLREAIAEHLGFTLPPAGRSPENVDPRWQGWAENAASRGVKVRDAATDANKVLGENAPPQSKCAELLKTAKAARGEDVRRGRPRGSKTKPVH